MSSTAVSLCLPTKAVGKQGLALHPALLTHQLLSASRVHLLRTLSIWLGNWFTHFVSGKEAELREEKRFAEVTPWRSSDWRSHPGLPHSEGPGCSHHGRRALHWLQFRSGFSPRLRHLGKGLFLTSLCLSFLISEWA